MKRRTKNDANPSNASFLSAYHNSILEEGREDACNEAYLTCKSEIKDSMRAGYCPNDDVVKQLDNLCHHGTMSEPASPLVIVGANGIGKTALIAHWMKRRRAQTQVNEINWECIH